MLHLLTEQNENRFLHVAFHVSAKSSVANMHLPEFKPTLVAVQDGKTVEDELVYFDETVIVDAPELPKPPLEVPSFERNDL